MTCTFDTPGESEFTVPDIATEITATVIGGKGGDGGDVDPRIVGRGLRAEVVTKADGGASGYGVQVTSTLSVEPGEKLFIVVGKYGGGDVDSAAGFGANGGAGGGASEITKGFRGSDRAIVAAGGGGGAGAGDSGNSRGGGGGSGNDRLCDNARCGNGGAGGHGAGDGEESCQGLGAGQPGPGCDCVTGTACPDGNDNETSAGIEGQASSDIQRPYPCTRATRGIAASRGASNGGAGGIASGRVGAGGGGGGGWRGGCAGGHGKGSSGGGGGGGAGSSIDTIGLDTIGKETVFSTAAASGGSVVLTFRFVQIIAPIGFIPDPRWPRVIELLCHWRNDDRPFSQPYCAFS